MNPVNCIEARAVGAFSRRESSEKELNTWRKECRHFPHKTTSYNTTFLSHNFPCQMNLLL